MPESGASVPRLPVEDVGEQRARLGEPAGPEKGRGLVHGALEPEIELWSDGCGVRLYG